MNVAWAQMVNLPPREIGRCERAISKALEWGLWVRKANMLQQTMYVSPCS